MTRILADLPDDDIEWLDRLAVEQGKSRAQLLREAVAAYRPQTQQNWLEGGFGAWARHGVDIESQAYDSHRRAEWIRPWDDDYEEVRDKASECFSEYDQKERAHYLKLATKNHPENGKDS